jgi:hypothetical protein
LRTGEGLFEMHLFTPKNSLMYLGKLSLSKTALVLETAYSLLIRLLRQAYWRSHQEFDGVLAFLVQE